jgi:uncharacterized repeat protein (TIGR01451 family)
VTDDFEIADLDFRADSVTHTFTGDLTLMLRSPDGAGTDFISLIGGLIDGGPGDNITNMVVDDEQAAIAANDMVQASAVAAPYTKSWLPVFNAPWPPLAGFPPADPVGNLSRFDGKSTRGIWTVHASDQFAFDTGTLNAWSMLVTPVHFSCAAFSPVAVVVATKTVSGSFQVGGSVAYTIVVTNTGTAHQADNPGDEFTDVLPAGLTLVSALSTTGTSVATIGTNTVTWNGSLAPLGGSVTITISATINAGTAGTVLSNQGTAAFDSDGNGTNETTVLTDDPSVGGAADPTSFSVGGTAVILSGTKSVAGSFLSGGAVMYTIVLDNSGLGPQLDNAGNELVDVLPTELELVGATASSGTAVATIATRTITWNGSIPAGSSVTITVQATINPGHEGALVSNQGTISFDGNGDGTNEATAVTDDPTSTGASDPTTFVVLSGSFYALTPCRLVDTRGPAGELGGPALVAGQERAFALAGQCDLPPSATAVALNVTVAGTGGDGFATLWPDGDPRPLASTVNFVGGQTRANNAVVKLGSNGAIRVVAAAATHLLVDVTGYFQ